MMDNGIQKRLKILSAVTEIHQSIGANLALDEISHILVRKLVEIVNCSACGVLVIDENKVRILAEHGFLENFKDTGFSVDMPVIKHIIETKQSVFTGDLLNSSIATCVPSGSKMNSLICSPIMVKSEVKGIIHLDSVEKNAFDKEGLQFVELLSSHISMIFERSFIHEQVKILSIRDSLTGCFNRRKLDEDIEREIALAKRYKKQLSILMIDIDGFKNYNDFHGHTKGDELLKTVVGIFLRSLRDVDNLYRYGGEEFTVLLPETDKKGALMTAEKIRKIIQQNMKVTISIGVATFPLDTDSKNGLIEASDSALYRAKQAGKNIVYGFNK